MSASMTTTHPENYLYIYTYMFIDNKYSKNCELHTDAWQLYTNIHNAVTLNTQT